MVSRSTAVVEVGRRRIVVESVVRPLWWRLVVVGLLWSTVVLQSTVVVGKKLWLQYFRRRGDLSIDKSHRLHIRPHIVFEFPRIVYVLPRISTYGRTSYSCFRASSTGCHASPHTAVHLKDPTGRYCTLVTWGKY